MKTLIIFFTLLQSMGWAQNSAQDPNQVGESRHSRSRVRQGKAPRPPRGSKPFQHWVSVGEGCPSQTVQVLQNGNTFAILLDSFKIDLSGNKKNTPAPSNPGRPNRPPRPNIPANFENEILNCIVNVNITPPVGETLVGFEQVISGGIIKSQNTQASLAIRYGIGQVGFKPQGLQFPPGPIGPEDLSSAFTVEISDPVLPKKLQCREEVNYRLRLVLSARRIASDKEFVIAGVDSVDGNFQSEFKAVFAPCR